MGAVRTRAGALLTAIAVVVAACGGGNSGDLETYCALLRDGVGLRASNTSVQESEFEQLLEVAPSDVRGAVLELSNATRSLEDIDELDQLFDAAFDPDAQAARVAFNEHAAQACGVSGQAIPGGAVATTAGIVADLRAYVDNNFSGSAWLPKVRYDVQLADEELDGVKVTFVVGASDDEATQACAAISVYVYELRGANGEVTVVDDGLVTVRRASADALCEEV